MCLLVALILFVLRPQVDHWDHYQLVGECYIHGIMDGQAMRNGYGSARGRKGEEAPRPGQDVGGDEIGR